MVDPGDADPVEAALDRDGLQLAAILVTHHHADHIGGVIPLLRRHAATVFAPRRGAYAFPHHPAGEGDIARIDALDVSFRVMETPGHTLDHVVYYGGNALFCGDTLFGCGCGRLFEGHCAEAHASLQRLATLPPDTLAYPAHEYTEKNIRFARSLMPDDPALVTHQTAVATLRRQGLPSLPTRIGHECATNPFLRCALPEIARATRRQRPLPEHPEPAEVFCALRTLRDLF